MIVTEEIDPAGIGSELQTEKTRTKECADTSDTLLLEPQFMQMQQQTCSAGHQYTCNVRKEFFSLQNSPSTHSHVHQHPYKCGVCNKSFSRKSEHSVHMRIHTGQHPYQCNICKKFFTRQNNLTVHLRIHRGECPYACDLC